MKKFRLYLLMACAILFLHPLQAERVSVERAETVARSYARVTPRLSASRDFKLSRTGTKNVHRNRPGLRSSSQQDEPMYYVFTMNDNGGFIIVAGDDVAKPILGYSEEGAIKLYTLSERLIINDILKYYET